MGLIATNTRRRRDPGHTYRSRCAPLVVAPDPSYCEVRNRGDAFGFGRGRSGEGVERVRGLAVFAVTAAVSVLAAHAARLPRFLVSYRRRGRGRLVPRR